MHRLQQIDIWGKNAMEGINEELISLDVSNMMSVDVQTVNSQRRPGIDSATSNQFDVENDGNLHR